jgi:hypothetical protein
MFNNSKYFTKFSCDENSNISNKRNSFPSTYTTTQVVNNDIVDNKKISVASPKKSPLKLQKLDIDFKKPKDGTYQANLTSSDIRRQLEGYKPLRTMEEKKILTTLPFFKTWVKYHGKDNKLKIGGVMIKQEYPKYIMLMNLKSKITWSVQLENNTLYIAENMLSKDSAEIDKTKLKNTNTKNKLFSLYKDGRLQLKKD